MKQKVITERFLVIYKHSTSRLGESQENSWRSKYIGLLGEIFIIKNEETQYFQWHPIKNNEVLYSKGMISSNDDYEIKDDLLTITTENSIYYFQLINSDSKIKTPPIIW